MANYFKIKHGFVSTGDGSITGTLDVSAGININGAAVATQAWVSGQGFATSGSVSGNYLALSGGTLTGELVLDYNNPALVFKGDDGIWYRLRVDESGNQLELGHTSNIGLKLSNSGGVTFPQLGAGFVKTNASGVVSIDTNTYLTSVPSEYLTQTEGDARYLRLTGGTLTGNINANGSILGDGNLFLRSYNNDPKGIFFRDGFEYGDTNQYNLSITIHDDGDGASDGMMISAYDGVFFNVQSGATPNTKFRILNNEVKAFANLISTANVYASGGNSTEWNTAYSWGDHSVAGYAAAGDENIIDGAYQIWNPDGDGDVFSYSDSNPTHNGKYVGAVIDVRGDGTNLSALWRTGTLTADHVQTDRGYFVGGILDSNSSDGVQVIDANGNWVGNAPTPAAHNHDSRYLVKGGSWNGVNMPGSRWGGFSVNGGEVVFQQDNPNNGQMSVMVDGNFYAGERNGFWSLYSSSPSHNNYNEKVGFYSNTSGHFLISTSAVYAGGNQVWHAGNLTNNSSNWNTAYSWGNHASAGYLTSYTETDTLASVTARGSSTWTNVTLGELRTRGFVTHDLPLISRLYGNEMIMADVFGNAAYSGNITNPHNVFRTGDNYAYFSDGADAVFEIETPISSTTNVYARELLIFMHGGYSGGLRIEVKKADQTWAVAYENIVSLAGSQWHRFKPDWGNVAVYPADWSLRGLRFTFYEYVPGNNIYVGQVGITNVKHHNVFPYLSIQGGTVYGNVDFQGSTTLGGNSLATQSWVTSQGYITSLSGYATESYVNTAVSNLVDSAPGTLDTLNELAAALGDDPNFASTITTNLAAKVSWEYNDASIDPNDVNRNRGVFSINGTNSTTPNRPQNYNTIYTFGAGSNNTLQLGTGSDYNDAGLWIRQYNHNAASPQGVGWQNWATVWTSNDFSNNSSNWDDAYSWGNHSGLYLPISGGTITGDLQLGSNQLLFAPSNVAAPSTTNQHAGTRILLYPSTGGQHYAIGIESSHMWFNSDGGYKWYNEANNIASLSSSGVLYVNGGNSGQWNTAYGWGNHAGLYDAVGSADDVHTRIDEEVLPLFANYQTAGNYFTDGDTVLNMANNDGLVYNDTNNLMYVKADGTNYAIIDSRGGSINGTLSITGSNNIAMSNGNITGVNQIEINDPGEGIIWTAGSSGNITLAVTDDASDNILNLSGTGASLAVNGATVATQAWVNAQGFTTSTGSNYYLSGASFNTGNGILTLTVTGASNVTVDLDGRFALGSDLAAVNDRIDNEVFPAIETPAITSNGSTPSLNSGITASEIRSLINAEENNTTLPLSGGTLSGDIKVLYNDHSSGAGYDTQLYIGKSDTLGLQGSFPTYVPAGSYGFFSHASSDGVFFGSVPVSAGASNYYATIAWGDDATEYLQFLYKGNQVARLETDGDLQIDGTLYANGGNSGQWNQAVAWGNHAAAGYLTSYTEADTLDSVADRGRTTNQQLISTNPAGFRVDSSSYARIELDSNNNWSYIRFQDNGVTTWDIASFDGGDLDFRPGGGAAGSMALTQGGDLKVAGDILLTADSATTSNQARTIDFTGFDKEGTTDYSDRAYIQHTENTGGHSGSVLVISSMNDSGDGIAFLTNGSSKLKHNSNNIATENWVTSQSYLTTTGKAADSNLLDGLDSSAFLRSNASDSASGHITFTAGISTLSINDTSGQQLVICAGEAGIDASQTGELVYVNAENGFQVAASNDNWATGYAGTKKTIIDYGGIRYDGNYVWHAGNFNPADYQSAGTYNTIIGTDSDINTSGATIIDNIYVTDGVITSMGTRTLTQADLGIPTNTSGNWWNGGYAAVGTDGVMEVGKYIDFHDTDTQSSDFSYRITNTGGRLYFSGDLELDGGDLYLNDGNTRLHEANGNALKVSTNSGYIELGPMNTGHCHIQTDRSNFYFNTQIQVDTGKVSSYNEDLQLQRAGSTRLTLGSSVATFATHVTIPQPEPPVFGAANIVGETIEVVFDQSPTSGVDYYQVWSSVAGGSYGLIANIPTQDIAATMTAIDAAFSVSGAHTYRVYAIKNGVYSNPAEGGVTFNAPALDVVNMSVVNLNSAYYIQYDMPDSRFVDHIEIYMDAEVNSANLTRTGASLIYSGNNTSYMYQIGASDLEKFHQFWVEVVES